VIERAARLFSRILPQGARVLDVGCGFGFFVKRLSAAGLKAEGIDLSRTGVAHALSIGAAARVARIEDAGFEPASFDAVSAFYVIEHLRNPGAFLSAAARLLKPGGYLLLRWPQSAPLVRWCRLLKIGIDLFDAPSHLTDFTPASISGLLGRCGLETVRTWPGGSTMPHALVPRIAGVAGGLVGDFLFAASMGRFVAPGASKNTLARKPTALGSTLDS
jgi:SAM-dependent methyltransferase